MNIYDAKTNLSKLLERVEAGEEIVIARNGRPIARLVPEQRRREPRKPGGSKAGSGCRTTSTRPDPELEDLFYNGPVFPPEPTES